MGFESWKDEFYPVPANEVSEGKALLHSLQKWIGLREDNLEKHGMTMSPSFRMVREPGRTVWLYISDDSCALCYYHLDQTYDGNLECGGCPLYRHTGKTCEHPESAWMDFVHSGNPEPMVEALSGALAKEGA